MFKFSLQLLKLILRCWSLYVYIVFSFGSMCELKDAEAGFDLKPLLIN